MPAYAATSEDERITSLQAHHAPPFAGMAHQQCVDLVLRQHMIGGLLADIHALGRGWREFENAWTDEVVIHHHIRPGDQHRAAQRQQLWITRAGTDQIDAARLRAGTGVADDGQRHE
jgi:hypothetical protein